MKKKSILGMTYVILRTPRGLMWILSTSHCSSHASSILLYHTHSSPVLQVRLAHVILLE